MECQSAIRGSSKFEIECDRPDYDRDFIDKLEVDSVRWLELRLDNSELIYAALY